jgi:hypothetical protein
MKCSPLDVESLVKWVIKEANLLLADTGCPSITYQRISLVTHLQDSIGLSISATIGGMDCDLKLHLLTQPKDWMIQRLTISTYSIMIASEICKLAAMQLVPSYVNGVVKIVEYSSIQPPA